MSYIVHTSEEGAKALAFLKGRNPDLGETHCPMCNEARWSLIVKHLPSGAWANKNGVRELIFEPRVYLVCRRCYLQMEYSTKGMGLDVSPPYRHPVPADEESL